MSEEDTKILYNANPELSKMKKDVSDRHYNLMIKGILITGAVALAGAAIGAFALPALLAGFMTAGPAVAGLGLIEGIMGAAFGGVAGLMAGGTVAHFATMKETKQLQIDEEMVNTYMQGKNYWGAGYRQEVAEFGYAGPQSEQGKITAVERLARSRENEQNAAQQRT